MGQCYSVVAKLIFKDNDPSRFCEIIRNKLSEMDYGGFSNGKSLAYVKSFLTVAGEKYDPTFTNMNHPFGLFELLTSKDAQGIGEDVWRADFDASYSWENVMCEVFEEALVECECGSFVEIYPDAGFTKYFVRENEIEVLAGKNKYILDGHKWVGKEKDEPIPTQNFSVESVEEKREDKPRTIHPMFNESMRKAAESIAEWMSDEFNVDYYECLADVMEQNPMRIGLAYSTLDGVGGQIDVQVYADLLNVRYVTCMMDWDGDCHYYIDETTMDDFENFVGADFASLIGEHADIDYDGDKWYDRIPSPDGEYDADEEFAKMYSI